MFSLRMKYFADRLFSFQTAVWAVLMCCYLLVWAQLAHMNIVAKNPGPVQVALVLSWVIVIPIFRGLLAPAWRVSRFAAWQKAYALADLYWYSREYHFEEKVRTNGSWAIRWRSQVGSTYAYDLSIHGSDGIPLTGKGDADLWKWVSIWLDGELCWAKEEFARLERKDQKEIAEQIAAR